eukprot:COSAG03_NODE_1579_length_3843_cov_4.924145_1_plen_36_part_10
MHTCRTSELRTVRLAGFTRPWLLRGGGNVSDPCAAA